MVISTAFDDGRNRFTLGVSGLGLPDIEFVDQIARHGRDFVVLACERARTVQFGIFYKAGTHVAIGATYRGCSIIYVQTVITVSNMRLADWLSSI